MFRNGIPKSTGRDLGILFQVGAVRELTDDQLLDRFLERREGAVFEAIVQRHGPMVWGVCRRILGDHHDAEDAFQATFLILARRAASIVQREKLGPWLYGVGYKTARKARALRERHRERPIPDMPEPSSARDGDLDDAIRLLDEELIRLPEKYRLPVVLCDLDGLTHREASARLGWPIGTVSGRLSRARAMLSGRLSRRGISMSVGALSGLLARETVSAGPPARILGPTAWAASLLATGQAIAPGAVPDGVLVLMKGVMTMMLLSKLKIGSAILLTAAALVLGGGGFSYRTNAGEPGRDDLQAAIDRKKAELQELLDRRAKEQAGKRPPLSEDQKWLADRIDVLEQKLDVILLELEAVKDNRLPTATDGVIPAKAERELSEAADRLKFVEKMYEHQYAPKEQLDKARKSLDSLKARYGVKDPE